MSINTSRIVLSCGCNQACLFCDAARSRSGDDAEGLAERVASEAGPGRVNITGGEPTLDPRLPGLIRRIKRNKLKYVAVLTNGLRLASIKYLGTLKAAGLDEAVLSYFESDPARYDGLTATPGAFVKKLAGMENLRRSGIKTAVNLLIYSGNQTSALSLVESLHGKYGIRDFVLSVLEPDCDRVLARRWLIPEIEKVLASLPAVLDYCAKRGISCMVPANGAIPRCAAERLGIPYPEGAVTGADVQEKMRVKPAALCSGCAHAAACAGLIRPYALGLAGFIARGRL